MIASVSYTDTFELEKHSSIMESGREMRSFLHWWMDEKLQQPQNILSLGKRLLSMKIQLYFSTSRQTQFWQLICILFFPPQPPTRRQHYINTERIRKEPKSAMQSKALNITFGVFLEACASIKQKNCREGSQLQNKPLHSSSRSQPAFWKLCVAICRLFN